LTNILKIAGNDEEALEMIAEVYGSIIKAGLHKAESIKVAEALKTPNVISIF
jgi:UDP-N-acetyl-D-galactosamine dehydrogenase